jgi:hypothetical protein
MVGPDTVDDEFALAGAAGLGVGDAPDTAAGAAGAVAVAIGSAADAVLFSGAAGAGLVSVWTRDVGGRVAPAIVGWTPPLDAFCCVSRDAGLAAVSVAGGAATSTSELGAPA